MKKKRVTSFAGKPNYERSLGEIMKYFRLKRCGRSLCSNKTKQQNIVTGSAGAKKRTA